MRRRHAVGMLVLLLSLLGCSALAGNASADTAGSVRFMRAADSGFDPYTVSPSPEQQAWLRTHMWRMTAWSPYFDQRTSWYPQAWAYKDAYAIYKGSQLASQHPEWILKSSTGENLYIPYACSGGSCTQYAGDITNPAYRQYWIEEARSSLAHGYRGLFIDDVNMEERVGNGSEQQVTPVSGLTREAISAPAWRSAMAQFMAEVRAAFPSAEIVHNAIWFAASAAGTSDPSIRREIESANYVYLERGVNDSGLTGGSGQWSLSALFAFVDQVHALGRSVVLAGTASDTPSMEYNLASYLLLSTGNDVVSSSGQTPANWWAGWSVALGEAAGSRYAWNNLLRRDFTGGLVLVNPPGSPTRTVTLPAAMQTISGSTVSSVSVPGGSGVVLRGAAPAAPPTPAPVGAPRSVPTQTTVETKPVGSIPSPVTGAPSGSAAAGPTGEPATPAGAPSHTAGRPAPRGHRRLGRRHRRSHARSASHRRGHGPRHRALLARIAGTVAHATQGTVSIEIDKRANGRWVLVAHVRVKVDGGGRFARLLSLGSHLRYRVRARYMGAWRYLPSRSRFRLVALPAH